MSEEYEREIEVKYKLTPGMMKTGVCEGYNVRFSLRRWLILGIGGFLIFLGGTLLFNETSVSSRVFSVVFMIVGVFYLFNKPIYIRNSVRRVFSDKEKLVDVVFSVNNSGYTMKTNDDSVESKWKTLVKYHVWDEGILLYPQKHLFFYIPSDNEGITGGDWNEFVSVVQENVKISKS